MNRVSISVLLLCLGVSLGAFALTDSGDSPPGTLETVRPEVLSVTAPPAPPANGLSVTFSEPVGSGAGLAGSYTVSGAGRGSLSATEFTVTGTGAGPYTLTWATGEMRNGEPVTVAVSGVQDVAGNLVDPAHNGGSATGVGAAPVFGGLAVSPAKAAPGDTVTITFNVSEPLAANPVVAVNNHAALFVNAGKVSGYTYTYVVQDSDPVGLAEIDVSGADGAGNLGALGNSSVLEITAKEPGLPVYAWPAGLLLLALGLFVIRETLGTGPSPRGLGAGQSRVSQHSPKSSNPVIPTKAGIQSGGGWARFLGKAGFPLSRERRGVSQVFHSALRIPHSAFKRFFLALFAVGALACSAALAAGPSVTEVSFAQSPNGTAGTKVDIYYTLTAPNGPCDITVKLSKDGGVDGFPFAVTSVSGDIADVTEGTVKHIVWDIAADYPNQTMANAALRVTAEDGFHELTYTAGTNGTIDGESSQTQIVNDGASGAAVSAVAGTGYHFVKWSDNNTANPRTDNPVNADLSVTAEFSINSYAIGVTSGGNGTVGGSGTFDHFATVTLSATPGTGYHFVNWTEGGTEVSTDPGYSFTATASRTLVGNFAINNYTIGITSGGNGAVGGGGNYDHGLTVTLSASPSTGYHFVNWTEGGTPVSTDPAYSFTATAARTLVGNFAINNYTIGVTSGGNGTVGGGGDYDHDAPVTLSASANAGYHFVNWTEGGTPVSTDPAYSFTATAARTLVGNFAPDTPVVTAFAINSGSATTTSASVTLANTATYSPTEYMASEASDFAGATWQVYGTAPSFTLSSTTGGTKTVYFKVRNAKGESTPVSDTISLTERTILLPDSVPLALVWVPSGSYQMGRYAGEANSNTNEDPQHPVTLSYGFWMGKYEITQQQWIAVRGSWPGTAPSAFNGLGNTCPAYFISWDDTKNFITSLNTHIVSSGQGLLAVRLPSEAEWEYACRAGTQTRFYWGDDLTYTQIGNCAWYDGNNSPSGSKAVGGKLPNAFGLYDMSGNVWEWCEDDSHLISYTGAPADGSAWINSPRTSYRILRGGFWNGNTGYCRSAFRNNSTPGSRYLHFGFRLAADVPPPSVVSSFAINSGAATTTNPVVTLNNTCTGAPMQYMASEHSDFAGASWTAYGTAPSFTLSSSTLGFTKTVYFKVRNAALVESVAVNDSIFLAPETVPVAAGTFTMGQLDQTAPANDDGTYGDTNELQRHDVTLAAYDLGKYEVTNQQYCDVLNWALAQGYLKTTANAAWAGTGDIYADADGTGAGTTTVLLVSLTSMACNIQYSGGVFTPKTRVGLPGTTNYSMASHPMELVSWWGSVAFCNWLSVMQGLTPCYNMNTSNWPLTVAPPTSGGYRLPTEAEWERAAAWGETTPGSGTYKHWIYGFLSDTLSGLTNRANCYTGSAYVNPLGLTAQPYTSPVGWFNGVNKSTNPQPAGVQTVNSPSPVGAYDMSGNVWQWCQDTWDGASAYGAGAATNPIGASGAYRVLRGGSWNDNFYNCRSARRYNLTPDYTFSTDGFRVARTP